MSELFLPVPLGSLFSTMLELLWRVKKEAKGGIREDLLNASWVPINLIVPLWLFKYLSLLPRSGAPNLNN